MNIIKRIITTILLLTVALLALPKAALAFGITPAEIFIEQIKPGGHFEREVYLTRPVDEVNEELRVVLETDLGEMESWFKFSPGKEFNFPSGKNTATFRVVIDVPQGADLDTYKGQIVAKGHSDKKAKEGVTIIKGAVLGVNVVASNIDVYDMEVLSIDAPEVNSGDPVRLVLNVKNLGNSAIAPDKVNLEVMDLFEKPIENLSDTTLEKIDAFTTKEIQAEFNSKLDKGQYRIDASVFFMGEEIARKKMVLTVNAKPAKVGEEYVQTGEEVPQAMDSRTIMIFIALVIFALALVALIKVLRSGEESDSSSEKVKSKLMRYKKMLIILLAAVAIIAMAFAVYYYLSLSSPLQIKNVTEKNTIKSEEVTPATEQSDETSKEATSSSEKEVKGASTESDESGSPLVVERPGTPGLYPVYEEPDFTSEIVYEAESGTTFNVIQKDGDWYEVTLADGVTSGWLHESSINKSK